MKFFSDNVMHSLNLLQLLYLKKAAKWASGDLARSLRISVIETRRAATVLEKTGFLVFPYAITPGSETRKLADLIAAVDGGELPVMPNEASAGARAFRALQDEAVSLSLKALFEGHKPGWSFKIKDAA